MHSRGRTCEPESVRRRHRAMSTVPPNLLLLRTGHKRCAEHRGPTAKQHVRRHGACAKALEYQGTHAANTGTVIGGKVVVDGDPLLEGSVVTILAREADETFGVPPELEAELLESIAQANRGETLSADELIERLRRIA